VTLLAACGHDAIAPDRGSIGSIIAGAYHTCAVLDGGSVYCWGDNSGGQIGDASFRRAVEPSRVRTRDALTGLTAGGFHTCALTSDGALRCWGDNTAGPLGDPTSQGTTFPLGVAAGLTLVSVAAGGLHTCALDAGGAPFCWGANDVGQLGFNTPITRCGGRPCSPLPTPVEGALRLATVAAGDAHTCGLTPDGAVYCWGQNADGRLGNGFTQSAARPVLVGADLRLTALAAGGGHTCALRDGGSIYCWGRNAEHQVGATTSETCPGGVACATRPVAVPLEGRFVFLATGSLHACAVRDDGVVYCWGSNQDGQLGDGLGIAHSAPTPVAFDQRVTQVAAGDAHTCALTAAGEVYCWGDNLRGQLGIGSVGLRSTVPLPVVGMTVTQ
jgi:alpha-tubulin suppressor-like RCC1 family protein